MIMCALKKSQATPSGSHYRVRYDATKLKPTPTVRCITYFLSRILSGFRTWERGMLADLHLEVRGHQLKITRYIHHAAGPIPAVTSRRAFTFRPSPWTWGG